MPKLPNRPSATPQKVAVKPNRSLPRSLATWMVMVLVVLAVFEVLVTSSQATSGHQLSELQQEEERLKQEVARLERQLAETGSLATVQRIASQQLGMRKIGNEVLYLQYNVQQPTAELE